MPNSIVEPLQAWQRGNVTCKAAQREQVLVCFLIGAFHTSSKFRPHRLLGARAADLHAAVAAMALRPSQGHTCRAGWEPAPTLRAPHHRRASGGLNLDYHRHGQ